MTQWTLTKGNAHTPARFWDQRTTTDLKEVERLRKDGWILRETKEIQ